MSRPHDELRDKYCQRYRMSDKFRKEYMSIGFIEQLELCKDESAVRLLLGRSEQFTQQERAAQGRRM